jgi:hypothetical protein
MGLKVRFANPPATSTIAWAQWREPLLEYDGEGPPITLNLKKEDLEDGSLRFSDRARLRRPELVGHNRDFPASPAP